jgi:hypothetical protein
MVNSHRSENKCRDVALLRLIKGFGQRIISFYAYVYWEKRIILLPPASPASPASLSPCPPLPLTSPIARWS